MGIKMRQKPIVFDTIFDVEVATKETTLYTMGGDVQVKIGDYLFTHPDGTVSRVKRENIHNFEIVIQEK